MFADFSTVELSQATRLGPCRLIPVSRESAVVCAPVTITLVILRIGSKGYHELMRCLFRLSIPILFVTLAWADEPLRVATFRTNATPPIGSPLCDGAVEPAAKIVDSLSARGLVLIGAGKPIVLVTVDWVGIGNEGLDAWRRALADAAGTTFDRVRVHTLHQHDAPGYDLTAERLLERLGLAGRMFDPVFARQTILRTAEALREAMRKPRPVTHLGVGRAKVEQVASNRRVLGPDGKVKYVRYSSCLIPEARAADEGVVDPYVRLISFWNGTQALVSLTFYATHPQSYYGQGGVSADFVGMARAMREADLTAPAHIHFNGAGGNVAAGKYNDGSPETRPVLAQRLANGMKAAWQATKRAPIRVRDIEWKTLEVTLPLSDRLIDSNVWQKSLENTSAPLRARIGAARNLAWIQRLAEGRKIDLASLRLGSAYVLSMPGELFVEYQLAASEMRPNDLVAMAAYADYGPGYIGTSIAYSQGGYEPTASRTAPQVEGVLMGALRRLLE